MVLEQCKSKKKSRTVAYRWSSWLRRGRNTCRISLTLGFGVLIPHNTIPFRAFSGEETAALATASDSAGESYGDSSGRTAELDVVEEITGLVTEGCVRLGEEVTADICSAVGAAVVVDIEGAVGAGG